MKKLAASFFLVLGLFIFSSCDDDGENSTDSCADNSLKRSTNILLGDVLERCIDGKWYAVRECSDTNDCPDMTEDYAD